MARNLPERCCREPEQPECQALHCIRSDDGASFVCGGLIDEQARALPQDRYRLCFVNTETDTMYDHDMLDSLDIVEVITRTISTVHRMKDED